MTRCTLQPADRVRLNAALPKDCKITKTSKTDIVKTRKLGIFMKALKLKPTTINLFENTKRWLTADYSDDPAAEDIFQRFNIQKTTNKTAIPMKARLVHLTEEEIKYDRYEIEKTLGAMTPDEFNELMKDKSADLFWKTLTSLHKVVIVHYAILRQNIELVKHLKKIAMSATESSGPIHILICDDYFKYTPETVYSFTFNKKFIDIALEYLDIDANKLYKIQDTAIRNGDIETLDMLMRRGLMS